jgi:hypothetical protein
MRRALLTVTVLLLGAPPATALAADPTQDAEPSSTAETSQAPEPSAVDDPLHDPAPAPVTEPEPSPRTRTRLSPRGDRPWIERWAPEPNMTEVSVYAGMLLTSPRIELFEASFELPDQGYRPLRRVAPAFGARGSFMALRWGGAELEAAVMPTHTQASAALGGGDALLWTARGALVGQLPLWSVTPFVLVGGGIIGVSSDRSVVGNDVDVAMMVGGGVKVYLGRFTHLRLDVRDVVTARVGYEAGLSNSPEILLGVGMTLGRRKDEVVVPRRSAPRATTPDP